MLISILMSKIVFIKCLPLAQICPKTKNAPDLLRFGTYNILGMLISILMLSIIFMKYFPPVRPKLVPKLNLVH